VTDDLDRPSRPAAARLVDACDRSTAARLLFDAGMHHAVEHHVGQRPPRTPLPEITRRVPPDDAVVASTLGQRLAGGVAPEIDGADGDQ
jgi:hypothetical protein